MNKRTAFVLFTAFFCAGVAIGSIVARPGFIFMGLLIIAVLMAIFLSHRRRVFALIPIVCALGSFYPFFYESLTPDVLFPEDKYFLIQGRVASYPLDYGRITNFDLTQTGVGRLTLRANTYENIKYGNIISAECKAEQSFITRRARRASLSCQNIKILNKGCSGFMCPFFAARERVSDNLRRNLSSSSSALALGILFGDKSEFTLQFRNNLRESGTSHIVALSGFNITVIIMFFGYLFFFIPVKWRPVASGVGILLFILLVGPSASVVRAAIMGSLILFAGNAVRLIDIKGPISFAALAMVIQNPFIIAYDAGFILSFSALFGIVFIAPRISEFIFRSKNPGFIPMTVIQCVSASLAVAPAVIILFGNFNWLSFIPNAMIIWSVPLAMFFIFISGAIAIVSDYLAFPFFVVAEAILSYEIWIINFFAYYF